ncbi:hypothetical protein JCM10207_002168 [Rhodosporidiobolus poonsookiae]
MTLDSPEASSSAAAPSPDTSQQTAKPLDLPPPVPPIPRGRPRSTSISSGSPGPAPGVPLPSLFPADPTVIPPSPQSARTQPLLFNPPWATAASDSPPRAGDGSKLGWGHRPSLSVPGIIAPSPLVPGAAPRGGRHRRTQSVSPPGFPVLDKDDVSGFASSPTGGPRRSSGGDLGTLSLLGGGARPPMGKLVIPGDGASLGGRGNSPTELVGRRGTSPLSGSPTRAPRSRSTSSNSTSGASSPTASAAHAHAVLDELHHSQATHHSPHSSHRSHSHSSHSHSHSHQHQHHPHSHHAASHAALLHGVRSHPLPHSPTLDPVDSTSPGACSPLSSSPSSPSGFNSGFTSRRMSGGSHSRSPFSPSAGHAASPPFGASSPGFPPHHQPSPLHFQLQAAVSPEDEDMPSSSQEDRLDQAMADELLPLPPSLPRRGSLPSPPLLPISLPPSCAPEPVSTPPPLPSFGRSRSGSITRATSVSASPASLYLEHQDETSRSPGAGPVPASRPISPPPGPPLFADSLFPSSGTLPPPQPGTAAMAVARSPPRAGFAAGPPPAAAAGASAGEAELGTSPPFGASPTFVHPLAVSRPSPASPSALPAPAPSGSTDFSLPPAPIPIPPLPRSPGASGLSATRPKDADARSPESRGAVPLPLPGPLASPGEEQLNRREREEDEIREVPPEPVHEEHRPLTPGGGMSSPGLGLDNLEPAFPFEFSSPHPPTTVPSPSLSLAIPTSSIDGSSPIGTPEHVELSISPAEPTSSYFSLHSGSHSAPPPSKLPDSGLPSKPSAVPPLERAPSWDDLLVAPEEDDDEDDFFAGDDGSGEVGFGPGGAGAQARRRSSGDKERPSLLEALGIGSHAPPGTVSLPPSSTPIGAAAPVAGSSEDEPEPAMPHEGGHFGALGFMEVDLETGTLVPGRREGAEEDGVGAGEIEDEGMLAIDEESLSMLERIFVCAKSETVEDRARVAHFLPDWLPGVDVCEAVEYVLPLLAGLIEDETVKEVFAPRLDQIMWWFFSNCPLDELEGSSDGDDKSTSQAGSPGPSRPSFASVEHSPTSSTFPVAHSDESGTPPPTSKTSPAGSNAPLPDVPRISATAFTSLLGALLTDQSSYVAKAAETALVRFLCRLKDKPLPPYEGLEDSPISELAFASDPPLPALPVSGDDDEKPHHQPYVFTQEAKQLLEDEVITGIVLGLARLDEDDKSENGDAAASHSVPASPLSTRTTELAAPPPAEPAPSPPVRKDEMENPTLFLSPEEEPITDDWLAGLNGAAERDGEQEQEEEGAGPSADSWGNPLLPSPAFSTSTAITARDTHPDSLLHSLSSPLGEPMYSTFSPDPEHDGEGDEDGDEEASIGKMVSMALIAAIAAAECLAQEVIVEQLLPEVARMKDEPMFYCRKEAVQAMGSLAKVLPLEVLETVALPLHDAFSRDALWHVRRAAVLALPSVLKPLSRPDLRTHAIKAITLFNADDNRNVRSGALEICGELIYLFHEDPDGVPDEVLAVFLGQPVASDSPASQPKPAGSPSLAFNSLGSALDSPPSSSFIDTANKWSPVRPWPSNRDPDREILTAFNFPAVVLTLGRFNWPLLRDAHRTLCQDRVEKVRQSLASSLFEVAKIIGPEQGAAALVDPLGWFLRDADNIQAAVLENLPSLVGALGAEGSQRALSLLAEAWGGVRVWRQREYVARVMAEMAPPLVESGGMDAVLAVLVKAFKDPVAAVRDQAVHVIPPLLEASLPHPGATSKLLAFLHVFLSDASYRHRATFVACALACITASIDRHLFAEHWLDPLAQLARDTVVSVRIAVARAVAQACRTEALYADPATRAPVQELLNTLASAPERDVRQPVLEFVEPVPAPAPEPGSPPPPERGGARSRMEMYDDDDDDEAPAPPSESTSAAPLSPPASADADADDSLMSDDFSSPFEPASLALHRSPSSAGEGEGEGEDDVDMAWDALERSPLPGEGAELGLETREGGEVEEGFVEVSRR